MAKRRKNRRVARPKPGIGEPTLQFGPGDQTGFTLTGLTGFQDLKPEAVVRELVQNSMDAAVEAGESTARVRFRLHSLKTTEIPGINEYRDAFNQAVRSQERLLGSLPDQAEAVVQVIRECLDGEECEVLSVLDNGIGLDEKRMRALLGDGISAKKPESTGALGNGHVVVIPTSNLRYVLYGGVVEEGQKIGSGHTILAAHEGRTGEKYQSKSKDGFLVKELQINDFFNPHIYASNDEIPSLIRSELKWIREKWSHGTVVLVPGFNRFRDNSDFWDAVLSAAARNFFVAIAEKRLVLETEEGNSSQVLDHKSLSGILEKFKEERGYFLRGNRAYEAFQTLQSGQQIELKTQAGPVSLWLKYPADSGKTHTDLCRNGMWITKSLPTFQGQFSGYQAFHCLILLDSKSSLHSLVRKAEGPLHDSLSQKYLEPDERRGLRKAFSEIRDRLKEEVPRLESETFRPDDIFVVDTHGVSQGGTRPAFTGSATVFQRRRPGTGGNGDAPRKRKGKKKVTPKNRRGAKNPLTFQALPVPTGPRSCKVEISPSEDCAGSEFRIALDGNLDVTCDNTGSESYMALSNARLNGKNVPRDQLVFDDKKNILGVQLGELSIGRRYVVEVDYEVLADIPISSNQPVVFQIEMLRRSPNDTHPED